MRRQRGRLEGPREAAWGLGAGSVHSSLQPRDRGASRGSDEKESSRGSRAPSLRIRSCAHGGRGRCPLLGSAAAGCGRAGNAVSENARGSCQLTVLEQCPCTPGPLARDQEGGRRVVAAAEATAGPGQWREAGPGTARRPARPERRRSRRQASGNLPVCTGPSVSLPQGTRKNSVTALRSSLTSAFISDI